MESSYSSIDAPLWDKLNRILLQHLIELSVEHSLVQQLRDELVSRCPAATELLRIFLSAHEGADPQESPMSIPKEPATKQVAQSSPQPQKVTRHYDLLDSPGQTHGSDEYTFPIRAVFAPAVGQLEFQVAWCSSAPIVTNVVPNGASELHGIQSGDCMVQLNDVEVQGQSREELLPILRQRPLTLKLNRKAPANPDNPYLLVYASFMEGNYLGMDVSWQAGVCAVVCAVREESPAWQAGIFEGDIIRMVNGQPVNARQVDELQAEFDQRPLTLGLWRWPHEDLSFFKIHEQYNMRRTSFLKMHEHYNMRRSVFLRDISNLHEQE